MIFMVSIQLAKNHLMKTKKQNLIKWFCKAEAVEYVNWNAKVMGS